MLCTVTFARDTDGFEADLGRLRAAPGPVGTLELVVRRPAPGEREVVTEGLLDLTEGLVGDCWLARGNRKTVDGLADPDAQVTVMSSRVARLLAGEDTARQARAGDQLYVDLDLSTTNLPAGSRLAVGEAVVEVTAKPHLGCKKFLGWFGEDAMRLVNGQAGRELRLRGLNARVVTAGRVRPGDVVQKL
jgi:hypothetical protein